MTLGSVRHHARIARHADDVWALVNDPILRRFQYRITAPVIVHHRGTIDVLDLGDGTCVVVYATSM